MYVMLGIHPDIAYAVGVLSQYSANPGLDHLNAVNHVLKYLNSMKDFKLVYDGESKECNFTAYCNSDWVGDPCNHQLISSYVFKIAGAAISWSSKKQSSTTLSSTGQIYGSLMLPRKPCGSKNSYMMSAIPLSFLQQSWVTTRVLWHLHST